MAVRYGAAFKSSVLLTALAAEQVVAPGANVRGITVWAAGWVGSGGSGYFTALIAHTSAPGGFSSGDLLDQNWTPGGTYVGTHNKLPNPVWVPPGKGLYFLTGQNQSGEALRYVLYTVHP